MGCRQVVAKKTHLKNGQFLASIFAIHAILDNYHLPFNDVTLSKDQNN